MCANIPEAEDSSLQKQWAFYVFLIYLAVIFVMMMMQSCVRRVVGIILAEQDYTLFSIYIGIYKVSTWKQNI